MPPQRCANCQAAIDDRFCPHCGQRTRSYREPFWSLAWEILREAFEVDGRRYCHLLDARTGRPVTHWQSVSVVADLATLAGSYATLAMLFAADAPSFLAREGAHYLAIGADGTMTANMPFVRETK